MCFVNSKTLKMFSKHIPKPQQFDKMDSLESSMSELELDCESKVKPKSSKRFRLPSIDKSHDLLSCDILQDFMLSSTKTNTYKSNVSNTLRRINKIRVIHVISSDSTDSSDDDDDNEYNGYPINSLKLLSSFRSRKAAKSVLTTKSVIPTTVRNFTDNAFTEHDNNVTNEGDDCNFDYINKDYHKRVFRILARMDPDRAAIIKEVAVYQDWDGDRLIFITVIMKMTNLCNALLALLHNECFLKTAHNNLFQTALHLAVLVGSPELTRRLVIAGVQIDFQDRNGDTALHIACRRGQKQVAVALLKPVSYLEAKQNSYEISYQRIPQDLEIRNYEGLTCLLIAALKKRDEIIDLLLSKMADINARDRKSGKTCLHIFTEVGYEKGINRLLRDPNLDLNVKTYAGLTALEIAKCRNKQQIAYTLLYAGAKGSFNPIYFEDKSDSD